MTAKSEFVEKNMHLIAARNTAAVKDHAPTERSHNSTANLLRRGLGIVGFNMLEDFLKDRVSEVATSVSQLPISFANLPGKFQEACTVEALKALPGRAKLAKQNGEDHLLLIQEEAFKIHSSRLAVFNVSKFSFGWTNSNLNSGDVSAILKCFALNDGWKTITTLSMQIGAGITSPKDVFDNAASRRHSSAHSSRFQYEYGWLNELPHDILGVAAAIDILLVARYRQIKSKPSVGKIDHSTFDISEELNFVFLEQTPTEKFRECAVVNGRARKIWDTLNMAIGNLQPGLESKKNFIIQLDLSKRITDWYY